ncbi:MAG: lytic transglycosylase F, partial [Piscirickettsiaceae bacterium CG_4_10_14_0_2_um_filter_44_336]
NFFVSEKGFRGLEYDLLKAYVDYLNRGPRQTRYQTHLTFIPVPFGEILEKLDAGYGDLAAAGLTITPERENLTDFTKPYIENVNEILVSSRQAKPIRRFEDFSGNQVVVVNNSCYIIHLVAVNQKLGQMGLAPMEIVRADPIMEAEDILALVNENIISYTVVDGHIAHIWKRVLENIVLNEEIVVHHGGSIGWAVRKGMPKFRQSLNRFIHDHARPGHFLGNMVFKKYFENDYWIKNPPAHDLLNKVSCLKYYFQTYADYYDFDWKLIAALAYQESRFNNHKRSSAGALGIMQIKLSTAKDRHVNLPNIKDLETNIHAGVKYLAFIRDRYFSDPHLAREEQENLTLAAYNAGPAKVRKLQRKAEKMGLDPYKWLYNVEVAARQIVGTETVNYVTSIQKMRIFLDASKRFDNSKRQVLEKTLVKNP